MREMPSREQRRIDAAILRNFLSGSNFCLHHKLILGGQRVEYADGFGLARASITTPVIVLRFEAETTAALERIKADFRRELLAVKPGATLPY